MPATIVLSAYPGRYTAGGHELALSIGVAVPQRRVEVTDLVSVIEAVAAFGRDVQAANPAASFEVSTRVVAGRKPRGVDVPKRRAEVTDLLSVIEAVAAFGRDVHVANPAASFEVSTRVVAGRKPRGFDAADKVDAFGGRAFLRSDVDQSALHRRLVSPAVAVAGARAPESAQ